MNIIELGALGELLGGLAVIGSLLFVGAQVRAQATESRLATVHTLAIAYTTFLDSLIENQALREVYLKGLRDFESLEAQERLQFSAIWSKIFRIHESAYHQKVSGKLDDPFWSSFDAPQAELLGYPGVQAWWATRAHWHSRPFQRYIAALIDRADAPSAYPGS